MTRAQVLAGSALGALLALPAQAQQWQPMTFEQAAYVTCAEAERMSSEQRTNIGLFLAENAAMHYGVTLKDSEQTGVELGNLVRYGCTMFPNAYLFTTISSAIRTVAATQSGRMRAR